MVFARSWGICGGGKPIIVWLLPPGAGEPKMAP
jgi:hypothetical protein